MLAALGRHTDCVHILLEKGAKPDTADIKGFTALHRAVRVSAALMFEVLLFPLSLCWLTDLSLSNHVICWPLQVMLGSEDCVSALLEHGASTLCRDSQGMTPLHLAASLGHTELLKSLLKAAVKADPLDSILDYRGYTPTHWAAYHGEGTRQSSYHIY